MKTRISIALVIALTLVGCTALQNAYQMTKCEYTYNSISNVKVMGIDFSTLSATALITAIPKITKVLKGDFTEMPIEMTVNLNVKNPDTKKNASVADLQYAINIDDIDIASGKLGKSFNVDPGKTSVLPVVVKTDLCNVLKSDNRDKIVGIVKNFTGISSDKSTIKLKVKPVLMSDKNKKVTLPEVPLTFKYNGKK